MDIHIFETNEQLDAFAAQHIIDTVTRKPDAVLGLATGSTPVGIYRKLIAMAKEERVSFRNVTTFNLDEYVGLTKDDEQSYAYYMNDQLFSHIDIPQDQTHLPSGISDDLEADCRAYDRMLDQQPIDIQLLGLGHNGHIGFNEPAPELIGGTHVVELEQATREANARFFPSLEEVPKQAVTMGVGSILKAKTILLAVRGADKAAVVRRALKGPITTECPASLLQTHPNVIVLLDREAGRMMKDHD